MKQDKSDRKIIYISLIFIVLAVMYLMPSAALEQMLPEKVVRFRIAYPVAALALMGAYLGMGWKFVLAFLFSCTGARWEPTGVSSDRWDISRRLTSF